eukprot:GHUV01001302.1.p1 GENE.GHUV01001302.1~~GHUV01001302.1.p1  ORF type:complete len:116 (+),score=13.05 GHUV01001302.1:562-909(+)
MKVSLEYSMYVDLVCVWESRRLPDSTALVYQHYMLLLLSTGNQDTTTPNSTAEWLSSVLPTSTNVVKAFCNLSAYALIHGDPLTEHMKSVAASDSPEAAEMVAEFGRALGLEVRA